MSDRRDRLQYLVNKHKDEIEPKWIKYQALCKEKGKTQKELISNPSFYSKFEFIGVSTIQEVIEEELMKFDTYREEKEGNRSAKRAKRENEHIASTNRSCVKCNKKRFLEIDSKANDNNFWVLPSGRTGEGYLPSFPGLGENNGCHIIICIECGHPHGFNKEALAAAIRQEEENQDNEELSN